MSTQYHTIKEAIYYYYAKFVIARRACETNKNLDFWKTTTYNYHKLLNGQIKWSSLERELETQLRNSKHVCVYCGKEADALDHVIPLAKGGQDIGQNKVFVCKQCNSSKNDNDLILWWLSNYENCNDISRLAIGIYLKQAYEWHRQHNTLNNPAKHIRDIAFVK
ncbi:MAG: HNH endonuclease [Candidatus Aenigmatarchaeota archaeon]